MSDERLVATSLSGSPQTIYTVDAGVKATITDIHISNRDPDDPVEILLTLIVNYDDSAEEVVIFYNVRIPPKGFLRWSGKMVMYATDSLSGQGNLLDIIISGSEER
jgi:hypothetical protein